MTAFSKSACDALGAGKQADAWVDKRTNRQEQRLQACQQTQTDRQTELDNQAFFTPSTPPLPTGQQNKGGCQQKPEFAL